MICGKHDADNYRILARIQRLKKKAPEEEIRRDQFISNKNQKKKPSQVQNQDILPSLEQDILAKDQEPVKDQAQILVEEEKKDFVLDEIQIASFLEFFEIEIDGQKSNQPIIEWRIDNVFRAITGTVKKFNTRSQNVLYLDELIAGLTKRMEAIEKELQIIKPAACFNARQKEAMKKKQINSNQLPILKGIELLESILGINSDI